MSCLRLPHVVKQEYYLRPLVGEERNPTATIIANELQ